MATVEIDRVTKVYGRATAEAGTRAAVRDFTLHVPDRQFLVIVGPSGCGKSTVLRLVAGLEEPTAGIIRIDGREVNDVPPKDRDVAMVFQSYALYPHLTVRRNLSFALEMRGMRKAEIRRRVEEAASALGLAALLQRRPRVLSGGERQRVALGRAIVRQPKAFLFDEPLSNLDAKLRVEMRAELRRLHERLRSTMIYVTHDQVEAMTLGELIAVMKDGELLQVAAPLEIYRRPRDRYVAGFIGTPPMNFLRGRVERVAGRLGVRLGSTFLPVPGDLAPREAPLVEIGVRPEDVQIGGGEAGAVRLRVRVEMVEALGDHTLLYLSTDAGPLVAKLSGHETFASGDALDAGMRPEGLHVFSTEDGTNLGPPVAAQPSA
jgi:multiple sugar transport system ATP-binding protein